MKKTKIFNYIFALLALFLAYDSFFLQDPPGITFGIILLILGFKDLFFKQKKLNNQQAEGAKENLQNIQYILKKSWFLVLLVGAMNYFLITESIKAGFFDYLPSQIILTAVFPASCLLVGLIVGANLVTWKPKEPKKSE